MGDMPAGGPCAGMEEPLWECSGVADQEFPPGLYVVATPLGNAADVTLRALWVLRNADCIAAEDTRTTAPLLARYGIGRPLLAAHRHNEAEAAQRVLARLAQGERVALVSDAGTPAISDPGAVVVRAAADAGFRVIPIPGPSSMTAVLSVAGLHPGDIRFLGFPPVAAQARKRKWADLAADPGAAVLFEAPHRLVQTAEELATALDPARGVVLARELTKKFETIVRTTAANLPAEVARAAPRGEYVLVIDALGRSTPQPREEIDAGTMRWLQALAGALPASRAAAVAAAASGLPRDLLYRALCAARGREEEPADPAADPVP